MATKSLSGEISRSVGMSTGESTTTSSGERGSVSESQTHTGGRRRPRVSMALALHFENLSRELRLLCRFLPPTEEDRAWLEERINHLRAIVASE